MVAAATLAPSGGRVGRCQPLHHALRNRNEPRNRNRILPTRMAVL